MTSEREVLRRVDRALDALADDRLEEAEALLEGVRAEAPDLPERWMAEGDLASRRGEVDAAIAAFRRAAELAPSWIAPRVELASELLIGADDPEEALAMAEAVLADVPDAPDDRGRALFVAASALWALDREEDARATLSTLADLSLDDAEVRRETGHLFLELGAADRAAAEYRAAVAMDPTSADGWYGLGHALLERGDREGAAEAWRRTRALDLAAPRPAWRLSEDALEALAERTLRELPAEVRDALANVPILVEDAPSEALIEDGMDPRVLGLFTGTPLPYKEHVGGGVVTPDTAQLFLRNLENACADRDELEAQVRITILHETAHFFGLEDEDLDRLGLG